MDSGGILVGWTITGLWCSFLVDSTLFQDEKWSGLPWDSKSEGVPVPFGIDRSLVESSGVRWTPVDSDQNKRGRVKSSQHANDQERLTSIHVT